MYIFWSKSNYHDVPEEFNNAAISKNVNIAGSKWKETEELLVKLILVKLSMMKKLDYVGELQFNNYFVVW